MIRRLGLLIGLAAIALIYRGFLLSQEPPVITVAADEQPAGAEVPKGVEVQARGPIHEAFATPTAEPKPTYGVPKKPPEPIEEMPPDEKPEGDAVWIGGYWAWDDDRDNFLWVSGCWRIRPADKEWVPGYWREVSGQWQWVPGFWNNARAEKASEVTYYPEPPAPPQVAAPPPPSEPDMFYVPGYWMWGGDHYVWRAGYYTRVRPGYVYVRSHYRWTPFGHVFVAGYWDLAIGRRGVLYAPVYVDTVVVGPRFVYTPYYAVSDAVIVDAFFVRPGFCHYYFGDYYGPRYASIGFHCGFHYSRSHYDAIVVYNRWHYRETPGWFDARISLTINRNSGRAPVPPRTLVQQNNITVNRTVINNTKVTNVYNTTVLAPAKTVVAERGAKTVRLDSSERLKEKESATTFQKAAISERSRTELSAGGAAPAGKPRTASLKLPAQEGSKKHSQEIGTKTPGVPSATTLPKSSTPKGTANKTPTPSDPVKTKSATGTTKGPKTLEDSRPAAGSDRPPTVRPAATPERPATKKAPDEKKKK